MYRLKAKKVILTFAIFAIFVLFTTYSFAKYSKRNDNNTSNWNVKITSDTKDLTLKKTQDIVFKVENNHNVVNGKIAPGSTAVAKIELDLTGTEYTVDFNLTIDKKYLDSIGFKMTATIDGESYNIGTTKILELVKGKAFSEKNGKKEILLKLNWEDDYNNKENDTKIGNDCTEIKIPINITVNQHI